MCGGLCSGITLGVEVIFALISFLVYFLGGLIIAIIDWFFKILEKRNTKS